MAVSKVGSEFLVNTNTQLDQYAPEITNLANGGFVVTWWDYSSTLGDSESTSIKAQVFGADGTKVGSEFLVNTQTVSAQYYPATTGLADGGFVVTWQDYSGTLGDGDSLSIKAQVFGADGTKVGSEFLVNTQTASFQQLPTTTGLANGNFVVTWFDLSGTLGDNSGHSIKAQMFSPAGSKVGSEFLVNTQTVSDQSNPAITKLANGGFVVTWHDLSGTLGDSDAYSIKAQVFGSDGTKVGSEFLANTQTFNSQSYPATTGLANGGFVITWTDDSATLGDSSGSSIKAQVFGADGTKVGGEFLVNTQTVNAQYSPAISSLANGGFVITWDDQSRTLGDSDFYSVKAQVFGANGTKVGSEFLVPTNTTNSQGEAAVTGLANGNFVFTWYDRSGTLGDNSGTSIKAQIFSANSAPAITSNGGGDTAAISVAENNKAVTTVQATDADANTTLTYSVSGTDAALFDIDASTGALSFKTAPNFEAPADSGTNNVYDVVVTASDGTDSDTQAIAVTIVNDNETPRTGQFQIPTSVQPGSGKSGGAITTLASGYYVVTWDASFSDGDGSDSGIKAQIFGPAGNRIGSEFLVNTSTVGIQNQPSVGALASGGFVISWTDRSGDADSWGVRAQVFGPLGTKVGAEFLVNTQIVGLQLDSQVTGLANGGFVITWNDVSGLGDSSGTSVNAQLYNADGTKVGGEFVASTVSSGDQYHPAITSLEGGGFAIAWSDGSGLGGDASGFSTKVNIFNAAGVKVAGEVLANTQTSNQQYVPSITGLAGGGFVVSWMDYSGVGGDASSSGIKAQIFGATGSKVGSEFLVNTQTPGEQAYPSIARLAEGGFVVAWQSNDSGASDGEGVAIKAQIFDATGTRIGTEFLVNIQGGGHQTLPNVTGLDNGDFVITWMDDRLSSIEARTFSVPHAPEITSNGGGTTAAISAAENTTVVTTVQATDQDANTTLTYSVSGTDAALFDIDASTGALTFKTGPDFEVPTDAGANGVYDVIVTASDGLVTDTQALAITVTNANDAPVISSNGAGAAASVSAAENGTAVTTVVAGDADGNTVTYAITGGADQAQFQIDAQTGALVFVSAPNFEAATDAGTNNVYDVIVTASDGTLTDTQAIAVTVTNVNEAPVISSNGGGASAAVTIAENTTAVTTVAASDVDAGTTLTYSITGGADQAKFQIDAATGVLSFRSAADFDARLDANGDNVYDLVVTASDGSLTDTQAIAVTLTNIDEAPVITSNSGGATAAVSVAEGATAVTTVVASDPEAATVSYAISGGADAALFEIDAATGALRFIGAPDFETRADAGTNNVYDVVVTASDGTLTDTQAIAVTVTNVNEAPVIGSDGGGASASLSVAENSTAVTTVQAADVDAGASVTYSITGGADQFKFQIDAQTGVLSFVNAPNFEAKLDANGDNVYDVTVRASDGTLSDTQSISVTVTNVNEAPVITSGGGEASIAASIAENTMAVTTVAASDVDAGTTFAYSISGGADAALFQIDAVTGALSFRSAPNFEVPGDAGEDNVYDVIVTASDGSLTDTQSIAVTVTDANDAPVIGSNGGAASASVSIAENGTAVATVAATDVDPVTTMTYSIVGGADQFKFQIDAQTGVLRFVNAPNFEAKLDANGNNVYDVIVAASDGTLTDMQSIAVTVTNVNEVPVITSGGGGASAAVTLGENGTAVTTVAASDVDAGTVLTYTITGGADAALFDIDQATGALSFKTAPDFETPADADGDNVFDLTVTASDGALSDAQTLAVTLTNVNEAPVITSNGAGASAAVIVDEKVALSTQVTATDVDAATTLAYSIDGGADAALFAIDAATGELRFLSQPNIETPGDAGADNIYDVVVKVSDGALSDTQALSVEVWRIINGTPAVDTLNGTGAADHIFGLASNDTLNGMAGDDFLDGGTGSDKMSGGIGNDTYYVDDKLDKVLEDVGAGIDTVFAAIAGYKLTTTLENLTFTVGGAHSGLGNALGNVMTGNTGSDNLRGLGGNDRLVGLDGKDTLAGGDGNDRLDGGAGADGMNGGAGDDVFIVDNIGDKTTEGNNQGEDSVLASVTYTLKTNIESLTLTGTSDINGTGNRGDNVIVGNGAANILNGSTGNDTLAGGLGNDTLIGGKGSDQFVFGSVPNAASNLDLVRDFTRADADRIVLSKAVFAGLGAVGALAQAEFFAGAGASAAQDADQRIVYDTTTGKLFYDADGVGGVDAVQFATIGLTLHAALALADFQIIA